MDEKGKAERVTIYLAAPYSHPDWHVRDSRFKKVCRKAAELMDAGHIVFSPISHSHPISRYTKADCCDSGYWTRQDLAFLPACDELWILRLPGWEKSKGIKIEEAEARRLDKGVKWI